MFERFTERARQAVVLAQEEARALRHNYIGTEHLLLGLLREEEGIAAQVLASLDMTIEEVRAQVARIVGAAEEVTTGQIPFTPRAKKVLELSLREALSLGHNYIGTEHVLLGLVREGEGVAARILFDFDADAEVVRNQVFHLLGGASYGPVQDELLGGASFRPVQDEPLRPDEATAATRNPELAAELERVRHQKESAIELKEFEHAAQLRDQERRLRQKLLGLPDVPRRPPSVRTKRGRVTSTYDERQLTETRWLIVGWLLFAVALGIGILIGWAIWG